MTTLVPRPPYTQEELDRLYPKKLKLQMVQIVCFAVSRLFCEGSNRQPCAGLESHRACNN